MITSENIGQYGKGPTLANWKSGRVVPGRSEGRCISVAKTLVVREQLDGNVRLSEAQETKHLVVVSDEPNHVLTNNEHIRGYYMAARPTTSGTRRIGECLPYRGHVSGTQFEGFEFLLSSSSSSATSTDTWH